MSKYEFDSDDTKRYTLIIFLAFALLVVVLLTFSQWHGNIIPPTEKDATSMPGER